MGTLRVSENDLDPEKLSGKSLSVADGLNTKREERWRTLERTGHGIYPGWLEKKGDDLETQKI